jgi:hypothetical protein
MGRVSKNPRGAQRALVIEYLKSGRTLSAAQAWNWWQIQRLAPRIMELRKEGHQIQSVYKGSDRSCIYKLA